MSQNYEIQEAYEKILDSLNNRMSKDEGLEYRGEMLQSVTLYVAAMVHTYAVCTKDIDNETCKDFVTAVHNVHFTHKLLTNALTSLEGPLKAGFSVHRDCAAQLFDYCSSCLNGYIELPYSDTEYRQLLTQAMEQPLGPYAAALVLYASAWRFMNSYGSHPHLTMIKMNERNKLNHLLSPLLRYGEKKPSIVCGLGQLLSTALESLGYSPYVLAGLYKDEVRGNSYEHSLKVVQGALNADGTSVISYSVLEHLAKCLILPIDVLMAAAKVSKVTLLPRASSESKSEDEKQNQAFANTLRLERERKFEFQHDLIKGLAEEREARIHAHIDTAVSIAKEVMGNEPIANLSSELKEALIEACDYYSYMNCVRSHLSHMETGKRVPSPALMAELAKILDLEPAKLYASSFKGAMERLQAAQADGKSGDLVGLINAIVDQLDKGISAKELENKLLK